jgi:uncharacterized protein YbbC (DUF1343 family)
MIFLTKLKINKAFLSAYLAAFTILPSNCQHKILSTENVVLPGAFQMDEIKSLLDGKRIGLFANHSALINQTHLLDTLLSLNINVVKIFGPEHGFRGQAADGAKISDEVDEKTGIPIISLYGSRRRLSKEDLADIDVLVFDMQDVGTRFYTYSVDMHFAMQTVAESNKKFVLLDRPNPHGDEVDGPVLDTAFRSGIGQNRIPVLHGLTLGEMAQMINGEEWLKDGIQCDLSIVKAKNYDHRMSYSLPIRPSPNLPNDHAVSWYPTLALFEGTWISVARGTDFPFQAIGCPDSTFGNFSFTPRSIEGISTNPPHLGITCYGIDLRNITPPKGLDLQYLLRFYYIVEDKESFFRSYFNLLAGTDVLMQQIKAGMSEDEIKETWKPDLDQYKKIRAKYLLYPDHSNE